MYVIVRVSTVSYDAGNTITIVVFAWKVGEKKKAESLLFDAGGAHKVSSIETLTMNFGVA